MIRSICLLACTLGFLQLLEIVLAANMNGEPGQYKIANSNTNSKTIFSTDYTAEYFEVYSQPITSRYSEVFWRQQDPVELPPEIKTRFADKVMAIVGYEVNQVRVTPSGDVPVPITWAYNHHYVAWLLNSKKAQLVKTNSPSNSFRGIYHGAQEHWEPKMLNKDEVKLSDWQEGMYWQVFSEGNGGEFRMSYHGYPQGYAQLISGPDQFHLNPMQIDTWNREAKDDKYMPGPLPKSSRIPSSAGYSGLVECPCSDRLAKRRDAVYALEGSSSCQGPIAAAGECLTAARKVVQGARYAAPPRAGSTVRMSLGIRVTVT